MTTTRLAQTRLSDREIKAMIRGKVLFDADHDFTLVGGEDVTFIKETGGPALVLRAGALSEAAKGRALPALRRAAKSKGTRYGGMPSGLLGYFDPSSHNRDFRVTPFTRDDVQGWRDVQPLLRELGVVFKEALPEQYAAQLRFWELTDANYRIPFTPFTTATVNMNAQFPVHIDRGNLFSGFGVIACMRSGEFDGGHLVFPKWGLAVDLQDRDVLLFDPEAAHGNSEIEPVDHNHERITVVAYIRRAMLKAPALRGEGPR